MTDARPMDYLKIDLNVVLVQHVFTLRCELFKQKMAILHLKQSKNEKIRILCFLKLLKFKEAKYPYFFIFGPF